MLKKILKLFTLLFAVLICVGCNEKTYQITLPEQSDKFTINYTDSLEVKENDSFTFNVTINQGFTGDSMVVIANGIELQKNNDNSYTITSINSNVNIVINGIEEVPPTPVVTSIFIKNQPLKKEYYFEEDLSFEGLVVCAKYSDESIKDLDLNEYTINSSGFKKSEAGEYTITIEYKNNTSIKCDYTVTVLLHEFTDISSQDIVKEYDGNTTSISVTSSVTDYYISYSTDTTTNKIYLFDNPIFIDAGVYTVFYKISKEGYNDYFSSNTITINKLSFNSNDIDLKGSTSDYDGEAHFPNLSKYPDSSLVTYSTDGGNTYSEITPSFTDSGNYKVYCKIEKNNYNDYIGNVDIIINKIIITGITTTSVFGIADGTSHSFTIDGTQSTDVIEYRLSSTDAWSTTKPELKEVYNSNVYYKVTRDINHEFTGYFQVVIVPNNIITDISCKNCEDRWGTNKTYLSFTSSDFTGLSVKDYVFYSLDNVNWTNESPLYSVPFDTPIKVYIKVLRADEGYVVLTPTIHFQKATYDYLEYTNLIYSGGNYFEGITYKDISLQDFYFFKPEELDTPLTAGVHSISILYNSNSKYYKNNPAIVKVTIHPKKDVDGAITFTNYYGNYDGQEHTISVSGSDVSSYTIIYKYNGNESDTPQRFKNAGHYQIECTATKPNYETITYKGNIFIEKAEYTNITHPDIEVDYKKQLTLYSLKSELEKGFSWKDEYLLLSDLKAGVYTENLLYDNEESGVDNYEPLTLQVKLTVNKIDLTTISIPQLTFDFNNKNHFFTLDPDYGFTANDRIYTSSDGTNWDIFVNSQANNLCPKNAGTYVVYYKVVRENYKDYIGSTSIIINPVEATFTVTKPAYLKYDKNNKQIIVDVTYNNNKIDESEYSVKYCTTIDGDYTNSYEAINIGTYSYYIKVSSTNYLFTNDTNPKEISFTITKGPQYYLSGIEIEGLIESPNNSAKPNIEGLDSALRELGVTTWEIKYSIDYDSNNPEEATWISDIVFNDLFEDNVTYKITTDLYEDYISNFYVWITNDFD